MNATLLKLYSQARNHEIAAHKASCVYEQRRQAALAERCWTEIRRLKL